MAFDPETLPLGGAVPAPKSQGPSYTLVAVLSALLFCSAALNVAQFSRGQQALRPLLGDASCDQGSKLMCVPEEDVALPQEQLEAVAETGSADSNNVLPTFEESAPSVSPGDAAQEPAVVQGTPKYCRKDTWLLSCLFYKADINDELTDWKSVKAECDREPLCDGVNKYWTSDLWHISSSGNADGCDKALQDGHGADASAFYKEGSDGYKVFTSDGSCHEVDEWGNPVSGE